VGGTHERVVVDGPLVQRLLLVGAGASAVVPGLTFSTVFWLLRNSSPEGSGASSTFWVMGQAAVPVRT
jgi:hypothetical protein